MNSPKRTEIEALFRSPLTRRVLRREKDGFITEDGDEYFPVSASGIPLFAGEFISDDAKVQQSHYDTLADIYIENLGYPHTQEYMEYLDDGVFDAIGSEPLGRMAELCCGRGEAIRLLENQFTLAIGVDVSQKMLESALQDIGNPSVALIQGDATKLPLESESFDTVMMLGGIHHINDRAALYGEVERILKPGGRFIFREPVDDFAVWRWIRNIIYRFSPALDFDTEAPLRKSSTLTQLQKVGFEVQNWKTYGFFGFCLFMNSDVLVFNRVFRFLPGIRALTRLSAKLDGWIIKSPGMSDNGLIVVGSIRKPAA